MNVGKTLFSQVMEYVPWKTFGRIIGRHNDDAEVCTLDCADLFRVMAFSQLTWRESLRDIESCLAANHAKLFPMDIEFAPARSIALCQRPDDGRSRRDGLATSCHDYRLVLESVRLGAVSFDQGGGGESSKASVATGQTVTEKVIAC